MADPLEAPGQPDGATRPDWLEGNFTSVEAQAQAYSNARAEMHRAQQRAQELEQYTAQVEQEREQYAAELEQMQATPGPQFGQEGMANPLLLQLQQARETGDLQTEMALQAYIASQIADQKLQPLQAQQQTPQQPDQTSTEMYALLADTVAGERYDARYGQGAWQDVRRDAAELLAANPDLIPETLSPTQAAERLVFAAEHVQGRKMLAGTEEDRNQQAQAIQRRRMAQTLTGSGSSPPTQDDLQAKWERIANAPVSGYESLRNAS